NGIFIFHAFGADHGGLDVEIGLFPFDAHAHGRRRPFGAEITLHVGASRSGGSAPAAVLHQELAFDFHRHGIQLRSNTAIDSTCAVCGNMSITPAWVRR